MNKRGFFFTIDALLATGIIVLAFLYILSSYISSPIQIQTVFFAQDALDLLGTTRINELENNDIFTMWCDICDGATHDIQRPDNSIMEQLAEFAYLRKLGHAQLLASTLIDGTINQQHAVNISISGTDINGNKNVDTLFAQSGSLADQSPKRSKALIAAKRVVYGLYGPSSVYGPYTLEVKVWQ